MPVPPSRRPLAVVALAGAAAVLAACSAMSVPASEPDPVRTLHFDGPENGALVNADALAALRFEIVATMDPPDAAAGLDDLVVLLDGAEVTDGVRREAARIVYQPGELADGTWSVSVASDPVRLLDEPDAPDGGGAGGAPDGTVEPDVLHHWDFTVKATPPAVELTGPDGPLIAGEPVTITGRTEPGATVRVAGQTATAGEDGSFEVGLAAPPDGTALTVAVTDAAGNTAEAGASYVVVPSRATVDEVRGVHVSFCGWAASSLREPVLRMIEEGRINAVQLDLKDESGHVGYRSEVPLVAQVGADGPDCLLDLPAVVAELHELGVPVIGRIVAFADPVLARWAWEHGHRDWVIQTADGEKYVGRYSGFSNFAHDDVVEYTLAIAEEAAALGVDHILWDYLRRPDGDLAGMRIPGLDGTPEEAIVRFVALADERLAPYGVQHGASLYGIAADRPTEIAQDVAGMTDHLDYVAPMVYPSHWAPGEYGVADPNRQPYDIITATLSVWKRVTEGTRTRIVPWLEDTTYRAWDRPTQVREQLRATRDHGIHEFLMWDPHVRYTTEAYPPAG